VNNVTFKDMEDYKESMSELSRKVLADQIKISSMVINDPNASIEDVKKHGQIISEITARLSIGLSAHISFKEVEEIIGRIQ